jgi:hypothetical protein
MAVIEFMVESSALEGCAQGDIHAKERTAWLRPEG